MWRAGRTRKVADVYPIRLEAVGRHLDWSPDGEYVAAADKSQPDEPFHIVLIRVKDGVQDRCHNAARKRSLAT